MRSIPFGSIATPLLVVACTGCGGGRPGEVIDAGAVFHAKTPVLTQRFDVVNTTGRAVTVVKLVPSCMCSYATLSQMRLGPGERAELVLKVNVLGVTRSEYVSCPLVTDHPDPELRTWTYALNYRTYAPAAIEPTAVDFGEFKAAAEPPPSEWRPVTVELLQAATDPPDDIRAWDLPAGFELRSSVTEPAVDLIDQGRVRRTRWPYECRLQESALRQSGTQAQTFGLTTVRGAQATITATWTNLAAIVAEPAQLHFGFLDRDGDAVRPLALRAADGRAFRVVGWDSQGDGGAITLAPPDPETDGPIANHAWNLTLRATEAASGRALVGSLVVRTDHPVQPEIQIPWTALLRSGSDARGRTPSAD